MAKRSAELVHALATSAIQGDSAPTYIGLRGFSPTKHLPPADKNDSVVRVSVCVCVCVCVCVFVGVQGWATRPDARLSARWKFRKEVVPCGRRDRKWHVVAAGHHLSGA
ncbi:Protein of unknown function [Gryllus bimaculatus]|nr:Protein of unknown function [Gryllus bimaculatus]